jgi:trigger factor
MEIIKECELLENSSVKLKITVPKEEVNKEYQVMLDDYANKIAIPGFRKGKVPKEILIRKFGDGIKSEAAQKLINDSLQEALESVQYKPLNYALPELKEASQLELNNPLSYEITYDTFPEIKIGEYKKDITVEEPKVTIEDEDVDRELGYLQQQNAMVVEKLSGAVEKDNTVSVDYVELDSAGEPVANTKREGFTFTVGTGYNLYKIDDEVIGLKKDEEKVIEKEYPADFAYKDLANRKVSLKVKITSIKEKKLPEINDELAQDINEKYKTLKDLKEDLKQRLTEAADERVKAYKKNEIMKAISSRSVVPIPKSMLEYNLLYKLQSFKQRYGMNDQMLSMMLEKQEKSLDSLLEEWKPDVIEDIKTNLILEKIGQNEQTQVSDEELDQEVAKIAEAQKKSVEEMKIELSKQQNNISSLNILRENLKIEKIYSMLLATAQIKKGKKLKYLELIEGKF